MPEPVWSSDVMGGSFAEAGKHVKTKTDDHKPMQPLPDD
jgi:hypothetical protein